MSFTALEARLGSSLAAEALLMWICPISIVSVIRIRSIPSHHRDVEVIEIAPSLGLGLNDVDFLKFKRPGIPDVGEGRPGTHAQSAVGTREQRDAAGLLQQPWRETHGECVSVSVVDDPTED